MSGIGSIADRMEMLERRANAVRSRLFRAVDALDERRHQVARISSSARKVAVPALLSALGVAVLLGAGVVSLGMAIRTRRRARLSARMGSIFRGLVPVRQASFGRRALDKIGMSLLTFAVTQIAKRASSDLLRPEPRRLTAPAVASHLTPGHI
jgi:hypothetical protein